MAPDSLFESGVFLLNKMAVVQLFSERLPFFLV